MFQIWPQWERNEPIPRGWRISSVETVEKHLKQVHGLLQTNPWPWSWDRKWGWYLLSNGLIGGPGYDFLIIRHLLPGWILLIENIG